VLVYRDFGPLLAQKVGATILDSIKLDQGADMTVQGVTPMAR
jgi:hypothetical protein